MKKEDKEEIEVLLKSIVDNFEIEDRVTRERQIRHWRRLKLYWNNFSLIYWSEEAHDYRVYNRDTMSTDTDQDYYDKPVNVYKALLETIIAALSIQIPAINCVPDDADNPLDLSTAKAGDKIAELLYKHNNVIFLWLHALYIYCTEGMIAFYTYPNADNKYGTYDEPKYKDEEMDAYVCPACGERVPDLLFSNDEAAEFAPGDDDVLLHSELYEEGPTCLECGVALDPELQKTKLTIPKVVGTVRKPKSSVCMEVYGGLYVKVANYAKTQAGTPYLTFSHETNWVSALECYPEIKEKIPHGGWSNIGPTDPYEQYGRLNTQYRGEYPTEIVTIKQTWLRPAAFNFLEDEDCKRLKKLFPDGCKVDLVNDVVACFENACLDDAWTLSRNPMSDYLNHEPLGELATNIQDITNDLISLTLQTIEHGIAQTFADPAIVNFAAQRQIEAMPGTLNPTKPVSGSKNIGEGFYTLQTASLSPEIFQFYQIIQQLGQFVTGALPSLFGGQQGEGSSGTASEYAMAKGMALQRLQTPWKMMTILWKEMFGKAIPLYMKNMVDDERVVEKTDQGNFVNVFIRKAETDGKIGSIELEADEKLPITDEQQADMVMQLMQLNNDQVMQTLMDPENIPWLAKIIKIPQLRLPGEDDRIKQYEEINEMINSVPIVQPPQPEEMMAAQETGQDLQPQEQPSVPIDPDVDNHQVEAEICRGWLVSAAGRLAKVENPNGYKNVLLHMKEHMMIVQQQMIAQIQSQQQQQTSGSAPSEKKKQPEKVSGENNARTPVGQ